MASRSTNRPSSTAAPKSRVRLLRAFAELVQKHRYDEIKIPHIIKLAHVSRSTFYQHFSSKDDLLSSSIAGPFSRLAACISPGSEKSDLLDLLEHFWANRVSARALLQMPVRRKTAAVLVREVERMLNARANAMTGKPLIPLRLVAIQIAEVLLAPIAAWLTGESRCTAEALARALPRTANAVLAASYLR